MKKSNFTVTSSQIEQEYELRKTTLESKFKTLREGTTETVFRLDL